MAYTKILLALICLTGARAANVMRGTAAAKANVEPVNPEELPAQHGLISGLVDKVKSARQDPDQQRRERQGSEGYGQRIFYQLLFGVIYYYLIVDKYPMLLEGKGPNEKATSLQEMNAVSASFSSGTSGPILVLSWCCSGPRAAHTFHVTGVMNYWISLVLMSCFPCCTLALVNGMTSLNEKLGGQKQNLLEAMLCACCCSCCVIAQDAASLDAITGVDTELCGITDRR